MNSPTSRAEAAAKEAHKEFDSSLIVRWEFIECYKQGWLAGYQAAQAEAQVLVEALEAMVKYGANDVTIVKGELALAKYRKGE